MGAFNKGFLKFLIILSLLPLIPAFLLALTPPGLLLVAVIAYSIWPRFRRGVDSILGNLARGVKRLVGGMLRGSFWLIALPFRGLFVSAKWLSGISVPPTRFMGWFERARLLISSNQGPLVDGRKSRLSEKAGYESILVQGGMGRGKSSSFVLPNLLSPPSSKPSLVISDTSGELYQKSSGYLARQGYVIRVLNLMDPTRSETYNPLVNLSAPQDIAELAGTLVRSANGRTSGGGSKDPFWDQAAEKLIRIMAQCLINRQDPGLTNLANLRHVIASFDAHVAPKGQLGKIDQFVLDSTKGDPTTFSAYRAFVNGNLKTIQSVLMSADVALDPIAIPELAALTATNSIDFTELRQRPTALYVMVNQTQMDHYGFLLNLFYADLFKSLLKDEQNPGNPVWLFLDEFGHLQISGFEVFATTSRKYKICYALFLQSLAQLEARYGRMHAGTIIDGLGTEIYLPGTSLETARNLEARLGRTAKAPLMAANDIIRMKDNEALMLHSNRLPILLKAKRYYQRGDLKWRASRKPAPLPSHAAQQPTLIQL